MSDCAILPIASNKACSGKCKGGTCRSTTRIWVVAACEGMIALFEKNAQGALKLLQQDESAIFTSLNHFQKSIADAEYTHNFDQLVIIGSSGDVAWIHASLPEPATHHIAAEINYPLLPSWFKQPFPLQQLTLILADVFTS